MNRQSIFNRRRLFTILGLAALLLAASATWVFAQAVATGEAINACVLRDGTLYITSTGACKKSETLLTWNIMGPEGPAGPSGETGPQGPAGPASLIALQGTPCHDWTPPFEEQPMYPSTVNILRDPYSGQVAVYCTPPMLTIDGRFHPESLQIEIDHPDRAVLGGADIHTDYTSFCNSPSGETGEVNFPMPCHVFFVPGSVVSITMSDTGAVFALKCPDGSIVEAQQQQTTEGEIKAATCRNITMDSHKYLELLWNP